MSAIISPNTAASVAARVYDIKTSAGFDGIFHNDFEDNFKLTNQKIQGISGGIIYQIFNRSTGFALTAEGTSPKFKKHHIIGIRGSDSIPDWLSNANIAITLGPKNLEVHSGFQKVFNSMLPSFNQYVTTHKPRCLHLVGHSLGAAVAELTAMWASERGIPTKLYTFGAPRVVLENSAHRAAHNIKHYRVTHGADPVPNVPVWPFTHTVGEYQTVKNNSSFFNRHAHSMAKATPGYINTVAAYKDYKSMDNTYQTKQHKHTVLKYENRYLVSFSQRWQQIITDGLITFLKRTGQYAAISAQATLSIGMSFYDLLARSLHNSITTSAEAKVELKGLLGHMLVFVGKRTQEVKEITTKFIRWVLSLMIKTLYTTAKQAIERVQ